MKIVFNFTEGEAYAAEQFMEEHRHPDVEKGAIRGHIDFIFTPTSIGDFVRAHCNICDEEKDITDISKL